MIEILEDENPGPLADDQPIAIAIVGTRRLPGASLRRLVANNMSKAIASARPKPPRRPPASMTVCRRANRLKRKPYRWFPDVQALDVGTMRP